MGDLLLGGRGTEGGVVERKGMDVISVVPNTIEEVGAAGLYM